MNIEVSGKHGFGKDYIRLGVFSDDKNSPYFNGVVTAEISHIDETGNIVIDSPEIVVSDAKKDALNYIRSYRAGNPEVEFRMRNLDTGEVLP